MTAPAARVAVVGAGVAGLACARRLTAAGAAVSLYEKESFAGGRAATWIDGAGPFDHGAQYFTAESDRFIEVVQRWEAEGIVQPWRGRIVAFSNGTIEDKSESVERFVAVPGMRRLGVHLAKGLDIHYGTTVTGLQLDGGRWSVICGEAGGASKQPFDAVCIAIPSPAAAGLLSGDAPIQELAKTVQWDPCWSAIAALPQPSGADFDGAFINDDPILGWAARDSAKPRRGSVDGVAERWVLQAKPSWSRRYADMEPIEAGHWLVRSFSARLRRSLVPLRLHAFHWAFATPLNPLPHDYLWDAKRKLGMAGDWCGGPRIEGAFLSGEALAEAVLG